jgi:Fe-S cluster assembly ATP-binding protein
VAAVPAIIDKILRLGEGKILRQLEAVAKAVNAVKAETEMGVLIITHYQRILHHVQPDRVSIIFDGRVAHEGGPELVEQLEREGYGSIREQFAPAGA